MNALGAKCLVHWYIAHGARPLVTLALPRGGPSYLSPSEARAIAADLLRAADESEAPDAAQVSAERAP